MKKRFADPVKMIELGAPRLIRTDAELERYTEILFTLTALPKPTEAEIEAINLLSVLVERYESEQFPVPKSSPVETLRFLMEQNGLRQRDMVEELGSVSNVSLILAGKRALTVSHIRNLSARFGVPVSVFIEDFAAAA
jgi:HTH-type transcriptional regulator/antitoxin HigA